MHTTLELRRQRFVHHAVALDPALPLEGVRYNMYPEMGLAAFPMAGMSSVLVGFVEHLEPCGCEGPSELLQNGIAGVHVTGVRVAGIRGLAA
jgi:hypothetical protein